MNTTETAGLLLVFQAAYPSAPITEQTCEVWAHQLIGVFPEDAKKAADMLIATSKFFPSIAEFLEVVRPRAAARNQHEQAADFERRALGAGPVEDRQVDTKALLAGVREKISLGLASDRSRRG